MSAQAQSNSIVSNDIFVDASAETLASTLRGNELTNTNQRRLVSVDKRRVYNVQRAVVTTGQGGFDLRLPGGATIAVVLDSLTAASNGAQILTGHIADVEDSHVSLVFTINNEVVGKIQVNGFSYVVRHVTDGLHTIEPAGTQSITSTAENANGGNTTHVFEYPPLTVPDSSRGVRAPSSGQIRALPTDDGSTIDVMVIYTPATRSMQGGTTAVNALIDLAIYNGNRAYEQSGIHHRLRLVHAAEVNYVESGNIKQTLEHLTFNDNTQLEEVHALRDEHRADVVVMLSEDSNYCGIAWLMSEVGEYFESLAFAVVKSSCAASVHAFSHEIGHLMGADHDRQSDVGPGAHHWSFGYVSPTSQWYSVMAYPNCAGNGPCRAIDYYSNPDLTFQGEPLGIASDAPDAADNRRTLNSTAQLVANFRASTPDPTLPVFNVTPITVNEHTGNARVVVTLSAASENLATVSLATRDASAKGEEDYFGVFQSLNFAPGETAKSVDISIIDDLTPETSEQFIVRLFNAVGGVIETEEQNVTIEDDDTIDTVNPPVTENPDTNHVLQITTRVSSQTFSAAGEQLLFDITVSNDTVVDQLTEDLADAVLNNIVITDPLLGGTVCEIGSLSPSYQTTCTGVYFVKPADLNVGTITSTTIALSDEITNPVSSSAVITIDNDNSADPSTNTNGNPGDNNVIVNLSFSPETWTQAGERVNVEYVIKNSSNTPLNNITVMSDGPNGQSLVCQSGSVWPLFELRCTERHTVTQNDVEAGHLTFSATVTSDELSPGLSANGRLDRQ